MILMYMLFCNMQICLLRLFLIRLGCNFNEKSRKAFLNGAVFNYLFNKTFQNHYLPFFRNKHHIQNLKRQKGYVPETNEKIKQPKTNTFLHNAQTLKDPKNLQRTSNIELTKKMVDWALTTLQT